MIVKTCYAIQYVVYELSLNQWTKYRWQVCVDDATNYYEQVKKYAE